VPDRRWGELLSPLGLFRKRSGTDLSPATAAEIEKASGIDHGLIADRFAALYREDDDPKWIRESYYHRMLSGQMGGLGLSEFAGRYYRTELVASAHYCFERHRDYATALQLYDAAVTLGAVDEGAMMRRASSMIRVGKSEAGNAEYSRLVQEYPENIGIRRSHVDALLYRKEFEKARSNLIA
jgi:hypothetical protein